MFLFTGPLNYLRSGAEVVVVATAHGLKFSEHKAAISGTATEVAADYDAVRAAALD